MDWFFFKLQMRYLIFLLPFLCKIYRNSSILLFQGNVSPRLCFSLSSPDFITVLSCLQEISRMFALDVLVLHSWTTWRYLALQIYLSCRNVPINAKYPALIRTVKGGMCMYPDFWLQSTQPLRGWGFSLTDSLWVFSYSKSNIINQEVSFEIMRWFPMAQSYPHFDEVASYFNSFPLFSSFSPWPLHSHWLTFFGFFATAQQRWPRISTGKTYFPNLLSYFFMAQYRHLKCQQIALIIFKRPACINYAKFGLQCNI